MHYSFKDIPSGNIVMGIEYIWANINEGIGNTTIIESVIPVDNLDKFVHKVSSIATFSGTGKTISSFISGRMYRKGDDPRDTFDGDIFLGEADFHIKLNSLGSREQWTK